MPDWILNLLSGPLVGFIVTFLKRIPFVNAYPKICAAIIAVLLEVCNVGLFNAPTGVVAILTALAAAFGGAVATHEVVLKPSGISDAVAGTNASAPSGTGT